MYLIHCKYVCMYVCKKAPIPDIYIQKTAWAGVITSFVLQSALPPKASRTVINPWYPVLLGGAVFPITAEHWLPALFYSSLGAQTHG